MPSPYRSKKLLAAAKDKACIQCNKADGTVVPAHLSGMRAQAFGKGKGIKVPDWLTADLCMECHAAFDGYSTAQHTDPNIMARIDHSELFLYAILKTLQRRIDEGLIELP